LLLLLLLSSGRTHIMLRLAVINETAEEQQNGISQEKIESEMFVAYNQGLQAHTSNMSIDVALQHFTHVIELGREIWDNTNHRVTATLQTLYYLAHKNVADLLAKVCHMVLVDSGQCRVALRVSHVCHRCAAE
jgi:hypothetical protein